jgi:hypothetical protein
MGTINIILVAGYSLATAWLLMDFVRGRNPVRGGAKLSPRGARGVAAGLIVLLAVELSAVLSSTPLLGLAGSVLLLGLLIVIGPWSHRVSSSPRLPQ